MVKDWRRDERRRRTEERKKAHDKVVGETRRQRVSKIGLKKVMFAVDYEPSIKINDAFISMAQRFHNEDDEEHKRLYPHWWTNGLEFKFHDKVRHWLLDVSYQKLSFTSDFPSDNLYLDKIVEAVSIAGKAGIPTVKFTRIGMRYFCLVDLSMGFDEVSNLLQTTLCRSPDPLLSEIGGEIIDCAYVMDYYFEEKNRFVKVFAGPVDADEAKSRLSPDNSLFQPGQMAGILEEDIPESALFLDLDCSWSMRMFGKGTSQPDFDAFLPEADSFLRIIFRTILSSLTSDSWEQVL